jgi:tetratricopeptide (TPR) repeat protein
MKLRRAYLRETVASAVQVVAIVAVLTAAGALRGAEPPSPLREGTRAFYRSEFERAASLARNYLKLHPQDPAGLILLARAEMAQGNYQPAYQELCKALRADPRNIDALYYLGQLSKILGELDYQQLFAMAPDSLRAHQFLAESYYAQRNEKKAIEEYEAALKVDPRSVEVLCSLGDLERWQLRFDKAIAYYARVLELQPNEYCGVYGLGVAYLRRHELPSAVEYFRRAVALRPDSAVTRLALGSALLRTGDASGAVTELKSAVVYRPDLRQAYALLARAYRMLGQTAEAGESLKKAKELEERERDLLQRALLSGELAPALDEE